ncbi:MAG: hypothetical protein RL648_1730, partial [Verrucomicrobiota bacterium]
MEGLERVDGPCGEKLVGHVAEAGGFEAVAGDPFATGIRHELAKERILGSATDDDDVLEGGFQNAFESLCGLVDALAEAG